ncbi:binding-protein-dependent transport systems inner membrane component [Syntrophobotulus glycolicus DSM 8271]|uniref:Binding-protein-dependent transport systems inner membrane component n=1 Tax=Syntrophobotulus glycolicus (strain DSM 8271 / FlGlyR) TaxID=645991 RepID=F0SYI6_SYNGF|nr:ABC transporter permease [Syntrophobotulus glycolicus]ADY57098.1 binding-protein-dependent transport systems inner membrane component [Syntrophobotulus glycolicus DSM 8271]
MSVGISLAKRYGSVLAFLAVWELSCRLGWVDAQFIPAFSQVVIFIGGQIAEGQLFTHLGISLGRAVTGFIIAVLVSIPLGVLLAGWSEQVRLAVEPVTEWLAYINPFVVFHIIIVFMGAGEATKVTIIAWACIWPIMFSTLSGILHADQDIVKSARSLGLSRFQLTIKVLLPYAFPAILTGIRLSLGYALLFLIAAEMMGASSGLGWMIYRAQRNYQIVEMFSAVTVIAALAVSIDGIISSIGKRLSYRL